MDPDADDDGPTGKGRRRGQHTRAREADYDEGYGQRGRRRWPIVTAALVLLVVAVGGGGYGAWWYNQRQFYVGTQDGYVAIFRGTDQNLAGISLSSLVSRSTLPLSQLGPNAQATVAGTISKENLSSAKTLIDGLQAEVNQCHGKWLELVNWQKANNAYQAAVAKSRQTKKKVTASKPGPMPAEPNAADCAPAAAFGISSSSLPNSQSTAAPATSATPSSKSATPSGKATGSASPMTTPTPKATA